ncbi:MAG: DEAD/DEAH box helicase, partial [Patescibacteria group bacterium]
EKFSHSFPYQETPDQKKAIEEILSDLESGRPMDRVLAGDVGFGKTEVAFRAILRAAVNNQQSILLAPTTVLVEEHTRTMKERFQNFPIRVESLSRLTHPKKEKGIIRDFLDGRIDCLVGTHRILSKDIMHSLQEQGEKSTVGLLIIDEEQRFGVKQKEIFKNIRPDINILSISATPIPRTLSLALANLKSISVIKTPPIERIPIRTFVVPYHDRLVKESLLEEIKRGGQAFFLHNRVQTLELFKQKLQRLIPKARIEYIHGKTKPNEILRVLKDFREKSIDILVATTIIENGIDFPNANTLIVEDATRLGLSEAHQLRGRIGRGDRESYAYFMYRSKSVTEKAFLRLHALLEASELGSGYDIALKDLEIRGAGNIL